MELMALALVAIGVGMMIVGIRGPRQAAAKVRAERAQPARQPLSRRKRA